jgi:hypothetical protein
MLQTEFEFTLPLGYADAGGTLHREGVMRRATAADEILPLRDPRVEKKVIEDMYATDLAYVQDLYNRINALEPERLTVSCPQCEHEFQAEVSGLGGFGATPSTLSTRR